MPIHIPNPERGEDSAELRPDRDKLKLITDAIGGVFVWADTAEGHDFWSAISARLQAMAIDLDKPKPKAPPPIPSPPARPSSQASQYDVREWMDSANGIDVERRDGDIVEWSLYLLVPFGVRREWIADFEIGTNADQYTAEEAEALAYEYAERLVEACPQLRAYGINPK
jgi:hypothetical protein